MLFAQITASQLVLGIEIGRGAFAKVVAAKYFGQDVAVKIFNDPCTSSVLEEVGSICHLRHDYIVGIRGVSMDAAACDVNGKHIGLALVMQHAKYGSIYDVMRDPIRRSMLSSRRRWLLLLSETAYGLYYLHSQLILHRDIKPGNVLLSEQLHPLLADFGISCAASSDSTLGQGTFNYTAPEIFLEGNASCQTDVYAFGLLMWFVASGAEARGATPCPEPWEGYSYEDVMDMVTAGRRPAWPTILTDLNALARFREVCQIITPFKFFLFKFMAAKLSLLILFCRSLLTGAGIKIQTSALRLGNLHTPSSLWHTNFLSISPSSRSALEEGCTRSYQSMHAA